MLDTSFTFDGKYARTLGIELEEPIKLSAPVPNIDTVTVPGRNGDLHFWDGSYENRTATAKCFICGHMLPQEISALNAHLFGSHTYRKLETDEDDAHFLLARPTSGVGGAAVLGLLEAFTLTFDCKPQRFLKYGEFAVDITASGGIYNPTAFASKPIYIIEYKPEYETLHPKLEAENGSITVSGSYGTVFYDAELDEAYTVSGQSVNNMVSVSGSLELKAGENRLVTIGYGTTTFKIIPRWWEL